MSKRKTALLLLEGETEEQFYNLLIDFHCKTAKKKIKVLKGNWNLNARILGQAKAFSNEHPDEPFNVYVCIDEEYQGATPYDRNACLRDLKTIPGFHELIDVIAKLMCESLFFLDIEGIFSHLRIPHAKRNPQKFTSFRKLTHRDLSALFKSAKKIYHKGSRCEHFLAKLDMGKMLKASELKQFISHLSTHSK